MFKVCGLKSQKSSFLIFLVLEGLRKKQNWRGPQNFDIRFCIVFNCYYQNFIGKVGTRLCLHPILRNLGATREATRIQWFLYGLNLYSNTYYGFACCVSNIHIKLQSSNLCNPNPNLGGFFRGSFWGVWRGGWGIKLPPV